jgi:hypothetical protein
VTCASSFSRSKRTTEVSQRHLSQRLGMALGLTNLLVRRIVAKGWIKVMYIRPSRVRYLLTPAGLAAKARLTREYLESSVAFYAEARERIQRSAELSAEFGGDNESKRIVFLGAEQVAEIGYVRLTCSTKTRSISIQRVGPDDLSRASAGITACRTFPVTRPQIEQEVADASHRYRHPRRAADPCKSA